MNKIFTGHAIDVLKELPAELVHCCITSPPFFGLRNYQLEPIIWDGDHECDHDFSIVQKSGLIHENRNNQRGTQEEVVGQKGTTYIKKYDDKTSAFCSKCGAWCGHLGLEDSCELYIKHLCDIFSEVWRVLKPEGSLWVNISDSYYGSGPRAKSLIGIPEMFVLEMQRRGWFRRNTVIRHKTNCTPSSALDRLTNDFEYFYFFVKSNKPTFWTNKESGDVVRKKPKGILGVENFDWKYTACMKCDGLRRTCKKCKGNPKGIKVNLWTAHDYYFQTLYEPEKLDSVKRARRGNKENKYSKDEAFPDGVHANTMSKVRTHKGYDGVEEEYANSKGRILRTVWTQSTSGFKGAHFAVFPRQLITPPIVACCPVGGVVLDPFLGSGTTAVVALELGRQYIGIEMNPEYVRMAEDRIKNREI